MRYTRTGLIAILIAVEIFIAGAIVASAGGLHAFSGVSDAQTFSYAPYDLPAVDAGETPHVVIDDHDSHVTVMASADGKIHVTDQTHIAGWGWGARPGRLSVEKTSDGVMIRRPAAAGRIVIFGFEDGGTQVEVPAGAALEIRDSSGANISDLTGTVSAISNDGRLTLTNVHSSDISLRTADGRIMLDKVDADKLNGETSDGSIHATDLHVRTGALNTADGSITIALRDAGDVTLHARTADGSIRFNGVRQGDSPADYTFGNGSGSLSVATQDGSIRVFTNGAN